MTKIPTPISYYLYSLQWSLSTCLITSFLSKVSSRWMEGLFVLKDSCSTDSLKAQKHRIRKVRKGLCKSPHDLHKSQVGSGYSGLFQLPLREQQRRKFHSFHGQPLAVNDCGFLYYSPSHSKLTSFAFLTLLQDKH